MQRAKNLKFPPPLRRGIKGVGRKSRHCKKSHFGRLRGNPQFFVILSVAKNLFLDSAFFMLIAESTPFRHCEI
ncbi:hypothetical protein ACWIUD_01375 [Helicobacter sp. 23-1044]